MVNDRLVKGLRPGGLRLVIHVIFLLMDYCLSELLSENNTEKTGSFTGVNGHNSSGLWRAEMIYT